MLQLDKQARFGAAVLPHLDDALDLACWLCGNRTDAEDIVQEAYLKAYKYLDRFDGGNPRPWLLAIVRNACFTWLGRNRSQRLVFVDDARLQAVADARPQDPDAEGSPEQQLERRQAKAALNRAVAALTPEHREVILLREVQGLSYKEIAAVIEAPIGTVMSRLARARKLLLDELQESTA